MSTSLGFYTLDFLVLEACVQLLTSWLIRGQTKRAVTTCWVARITGCARVCRAWKTCRLRVIGTNGHGTPVETSQRMVAVDDCNGMHLMCKEEVGSIDVRSCRMSGSDSWPAAICSLSQVMRLTMHQLPAATKHLPLGYLHLQHDECQKCTVIWNQLLGLLWRIVRRLWS